MKISDFRAKYDLHDSLLEELKLSGDVLELCIYLCNWRQKDYNSKDDEMKIIRLVFSNVKNYKYDSPSDNIDSDTILKFECLTNKSDSDMQSVEFVVEGDENIKIISFKSSKVDMFFE